MFVADVECT